MPTCRTSRESMDVEVSVVDQGRRSFSNFARVKVKGRWSRSQGQGQICLGELSIPLTRGRCDRRAFLLGSQMILR